MPHHNGCWSSGPLFFRWQVSPLLEKQINYVCFYLINDLLYTPVRNEQWFPRVIAAARKQFVSHAVINNLLPVPLVMTSSIIWLRRLYGQKNIWATRVVTLAMFTSHEIISRYAKRGENHRYLNKSTRWRNAIVPAYRLNQLFYKINLNFPI